MQFIWLHISMHGYCLQHKFHTNSTTNILWSESVFSSRKKDYYLTFCVAVLKDALRKKTYRPGNTFIDIELGVPWRSKRINAVDELTFAFRLIQMAVSIVLRMFSGREMGIVLCNCNFHVKIFKIQWLHDNVTSPFSNLIKEKLRLSGNSGGRN